MTYAGIDVANGKYDCTIISSDGEIPANIFTIVNSIDGFDLLPLRLKSTVHDLSRVRIMFKAIGHYSYNILGYILDKGFAAYVINPLYVLLFRKSLNLCKTKTNMANAYTITDR